MRAAYLLILLAAGSSQETVIRPGESLAQVAARTLGSDRAGPELLAFNHLDAAPSPGTRLLLPGPERMRAVSAIASPRSAPQRG
jgi:hypothetical protein